jgi:hypothetical protein
MPPKKGPVWASFTKFEEGNKENPTGEIKARTKALCAIGCPGVGVEGTCVGWRDF